MIPAPIRAKAGLAPGTEIDIVIDDVSVRLIRRVGRPKLVRVGKLLIARPTADPKKLRPIDVTALVEEERNRWPW